MEPVLPAALLAGNELAPAHPCARASDLSDR
jgi:hypothetical protein